MNPTSKLITGGVLLFGALALANLLLPSPGARMSSESISPVTSSIESEPAASAAIARIEPETQVKPPVVVEIAPIASPVSAPVPKVVAIPAKAVPAKATPNFLASIVARAKEMTGTSSPKSAEAPAAEVAPAPIVSAPTPAVSLVTRSVSSEGTASQGFRLSATLQDRAWIRIGDSKTVMAKKDDVVPGLGKVTSVDKDSITLDNGQVLKVAP